MKYLVKIGKRYYEREVLFESFEDAKEVMTAVSKSLVYMPVSIQTMSDDEAEEYLKEDNN